MALHFECRIARNKFDPIQVQLLQLDCYDSYDILQYLWIWAKTWSATRNTAIQCQAVQMSFQVDNTYTY